MLALLSPVGAFKKGNVTINGDLRVIGGLSVNRIASSSLSVNGSITVSGALKTGFVKAQAAKFSVLETTSLSSPSGSLQVTGDLNMQTSGAASFLEVGSLHTERLIQHQRRQVPPCAVVSPSPLTRFPHPHPPLPRPNSAPPTHAHTHTHTHTRPAVRWQWALVAVDDFDSGEQQDWLHPEVDGLPASFVQLSEGVGGSYLGGHCETAGTTVRRRFDNLPDHSHLRLQARYHFIDSWEGETAFLQIDGKMAWMDTADSRDAPPGAGINVAGGPHPERRWGVPVDVVMAHSGATALIEFGSNLDEHACDESFGVDDVQLHVR